jgi:hypothetical protein
MLLSCVVPISGAYETNKTNETIEQVYQLNGEGTHNACLHV